MILNNKKLSLQNVAINLSELLALQESNNFAVETLLLFESCHMKTLYHVGEKCDGLQPWKKSRGF